MKRKGVKLLFAPRTGIRRWIANQNLNISVAVGEREGVWGKRTRILSIRGGEARFGAGGVVFVKMPGSSRWWSGFAQCKVLKILDLSGKVLARNWFFCDSCVANSGEMVGEPKPRSETAGRYDATFACTTPDCDNFWELVI